ncbi:MAG: hypothetical protein AAFU66_03715 [Pseudomonadota bacterium]
MTAEKPYERILRQHRGNSPQVDAPAPSAEYAAYHDSGGHPQMGFTLYCANGEVHGFLYHNLDNMRLVPGDNWQHLQFTHRGVAVTLKGLQLEPLFQGIMRHSLEAVFVQRTDEKPDGDDTVVSYAFVTDVSGIDMDQSVTV